MPNKTILIVDDDDSLVRMLTVRCRNLGLDVVSAPDGAVAREKIQKNVPGLIILDINMPRSGGFDVCKMMAMHKNLEHVPVIVLTGESEPKYMDECRRFGAFYIPKSPYLWDSLKPMLGRWFHITKAA